MAINPNDPAKPKRVYARDPFSPVGRVSLLVDGETVRAWMSAFGSEAKLGEFVGLVHGVVLDEHARRCVLTDGLLRPKAIFVGLNRPLHNYSADDDKVVHIYITNPGKNFRYPLENKHGADAVEPAPVPITSVFATYVTFDPDYISTLRNQILDKAPPDESSGNAPKGVILGWEWLEESAENPGLPFDSEDRFDGRLL